MKSNSAKVYIGKTKVLVISVIVGSCVFLFQNCGIERPHVDSSSLAVSLSPVAHKDLPQTVNCASCHEARRPATNIGNHNFDHKNTSWSNQDCVTCHTNRETWGYSWQGGQFSHDPFPTACLDCHRSQTPTSSIFVGNNTARPFMHTAGAECITCHSNTSKFNVLADFRPATFEPSGLAGNKIFKINVITPTFSGAVMGRSAPVPLTFKLEIDHGDSQVGDLACVNCHTTSSSNGSFAGALFHRNIVLNPTTCVQCHVNARPTGVVGVKGLMRHEAVNWTSNVVGVVNRGNTTIVATECISCHLNAASMPLAGAAPIAGSRPFSGASFHLNTSIASLSSCLDCHAHNRPAGSANFTDALWKNKTNVGAPPFTTYDLVRHSPNVDCVSCHRAPSVANSAAANWAVGNFLHNSAATNCLNCHTAAGVTSTSHSGFSSNCVGCHVGSVSKFPNPIIGDWKLAVTGNVPGGVVGEKSVLSAVTCVGVLAALPNCNPSSPNTITKGYNHAINTNVVSCQNCHGAGAASSANGKFHTAPLGVVGWIAPAAADVANCINCHDPAVAPITVFSIKNIGMVGSQVSNSAGVTPFAGANHVYPLIAGQQCSQCHIEPKPAVASVWTTATKIHAKFTQAQISTCVACHIKRMPSGLMARKNQNIYKGAHNPQKFTHTSTLSAPSIAGQECSTCHTNDGVSWTTAGRVSFHNKVSPVANCNTCHVAPTGTVTSSTTGTAFDHGIPANFADCATCHQATLAKISARIPTAIDWDGGIGTPLNYTIPSHVSSGITVPGYTGVHSKSTNCTSCHGTGNYKVITDFDHMGLPAGQNSCVSCHLGSKADVAAFIASTSGITMKTLGNRHHPVAKFNGTALSCVGCHTVSRGLATFTNVNGIVFPTAGRQGYISIGCGSTNPTTFSCHESGQRTMVVPITTGTSGRW